MHFEAPLDGFPKLDEVIVHFAHPAYQFGSCLEPSGLRLDFIETLQYKFAIGFICLDEIQTSATANTNFFGGAGHRLDGAFTPCNGANCSGILILDEILRMTIG